MLLGSVRSSKAGGKTMEKTRAASKNYESAGGPQE